MPSDTASDELGRAENIDEWLLVLSGSPVLREPTGRRSLLPGDVVGFPAGPAGAHTAASRAGS